MSPGRDETEEVFGESDCKKMCEGSSRDGREDEMASGLDHESEFEGCLVVSDRTSR